MPITLQAVYPGQSNPVTGEARNLSTIGLPNVKAAVTLTGYSVTITTIRGSNKYDVTLAIKAAVKIVSEKKPGADGGTVTVTSATKGTGDPVLTLSPGSSNDITLNSVTLVATVNKSGQSTVEIALIAEAEGIPSNQTTIETVEVSIPVNIKVQYIPAGGVEESEQSGTISSVQIKLPAKKSGAADQSAYSEDRKLTITPAAERSGAGPKTLEITVEAKAGDAGTDPKAKFVQLSGHAFTPHHGYHSIYSVRNSTGTTANKDIWANIVGQCTFAACYKKNTQALLCLYLRGGGSPERKYFGTENTKQITTHPWKTINEDNFITKLKELAGKQAFSLPQGTGTVTPQYNRY